MELIDTLLADIPAEEVKDERLGKYDDAVFVKPVEIRAMAREDGGTDYSLGLTFKVVNDKGEHQAVAFVSVPGRDAEQWQKNFLLRWLHAFGLLPITNKNVPVLPDGDEETRRTIVEKIAAAFNTQVGQTVSITITESKKGFVNVNPGKARRTE